MESLDLHQISVRDLNHYLHKELPGKGVDRVEILNPDGAHNIAAGMDTPVAIDIRGHGENPAGRNGLDTWPQ